MDIRLLQLFEQELKHLRSMGKEFGDRHPGAAEHFGLTEHECDDPYVARLLEGFAYLTARIQRQAQDEFPRFTQSLLDLIYPNYLAPVPSMAVVELEPDLGQAVAGHRVPRLTELRAAAVTSPRCTFLTGHEVTLWPIELVDVRFDASLPPVEGPIPHDARAAFRLRLRSTLPFSELPLDKLTLFVPGEGVTTARCFEALLGNTRAIAARPTALDDRGFAHPFVISPGKGPCVAPVGFEDDEALLPVRPVAAQTYGDRVFGGYRLLQEYFAFPQRFLFVELLGLRAALAHCAASTEIELLLVVGGTATTAALARSLEGPVNAQRARTFRLHCTPAINLFPKNTAPVLLRKSESEHCIVADHARRGGFEIHTVQQVLGSSAQGGSQVEFAPLYSPRRADDAYYTTERRAAQAPGGAARSARREYPGSEVYVALVERDQGPYSRELKHLNVRALCTNRGLPFELPPGSELSCQTDGMVGRVHCVAGPSRPRASGAAGPLGWRLINHLSANYASLVGEGVSGHLPLRRLLELYSDPSDPVAMRAVEGVRSLSAKRVVRPLPGRGPICYGRGLELHLECEERAFEATGAFVLGAVLERFFARYVAINTFTETVLSTPQRGEVMRWPMRIGRRPLL